MSKQYTIRTTDGNRYEVDENLQFLRFDVQWMRDVLKFDLPDEKGTKYIMVSQIVSVTEREKEE